MGSRSSYMMAGKVLAAGPRTKMLSVLMTGLTVVAWTDRVQGQATVNGLMTTKTDTATKYEAEGVVNTSKAWTAPGGGAVVGPSYDIPALMPRPVPDPGAFWKFSLRHTADEFVAGQATNARLHLKGKHLRPPHAGEVAPNDLPEISSAPVNINAVGVGKAARMANWGGVPHLGGDPPHTDSYGFVATGVTYTVLGATATLGGGKVEVFADHDDSIPKRYRSMKIGSSVASSGMHTPGGSTVSFNAETGTLSFAPGRIDVLDLQGGLSRGVDPRYAHDRMLGSQIQVSELVFQGLEPDGRFRFSGGNVSVVDHSGQLGMTASFDEYIIGDTSLPDALDSFGVLDEGFIYELDWNDTPTFLGDFADDHLLGRLPTSNGLSNRVIDLSFITGPGMDLATLTNGFTTSAMFIPADIGICGNGYDVPQLTPGDYNGDGRVDLRDYSVWTADYGLSHSAADGNGDGIVDTGDYVLWRDNMGTVAGHLGAGHLAGDAISIPEPSVAALALISLCLAIPACRRRS